MVQPPGFSPGAFLCPLNAPPIVAGFFMPCPCDGSSGVLSGLFFGYVFILPCAFSPFTAAVTAFVQRAFRAPFPVNLWQAFQKLPAAATWQPQSGK
nr:MAG TPA: hypothetical protein [Caudoviricetes sp.]